MECDACRDSVDTVVVEFPVGEDENDVYQYDMCADCLAEKLEVFLAQMEYEDVDSLISAWFNN